MLLAYYLPLYPCYFHSTYEGQHWWNWIWQVYPVWASLIFFALTRVLAPFVAGWRSLTIIRGTFAVFILFSAASYWYTVFTADLSLNEIFIPKYLVQAPQDPVVALRTILQYDYLCCFGAALLWTGLSIRESKAQGLLQTSYAALGVLAVLMTGFCGFGSMVLGAWLLREELLARRDEKATLKTK